MNSNHVTVVYKWTAQPGKLDELTAIYKPGHRRDGAERAGRRDRACLRLSRRQRSVRPRRVRRREAIGFHLGTTAAGHFPDLLAIATPGPFFFLGDDPAEMKAATAQMQLAAEFATHAAGFDR